jgi:hypothetical protein
MALAEAQNWRCAYCGGLMAFEGMGADVATVDHLLARSAGGTDGKWNLVAACAGCNSGRGQDFPAQQFFRLRQRLRRLGLWAACTTPSRPLFARLRRMGSRWTPKPGVRRFIPDEVLAHIEGRHPQCPEDLRERLARTVSKRTWGNAHLGKAFGIVAAEYVRQESTDYRRLLQVPGITPAEARLIVKLEVRDIILSWQEG